MTRRRPPLVERMREHTGTVFGEMSALAAATGAINLGQGFPDTDGPEVVKLAAIRAIAEGRGNQYPPAHGLPELREAIAVHQQRFYGLDVDPATEVVVATGASVAIAASPARPGGAGRRGRDVRAVVRPCTPPRPRSPARAGSRSRSPAPLFLVPDLVALDEASTASTGSCSPNSPHNPTGSVFTRAEQEQLAAIARRHDLVVVSDEAYEHLVFDGSAHVPFATLPGMAERTVTVGSAGKSLSMTGWKVGWATGPPDLVAAVRVARQHLSYVSSGPFQWAVAEGLALPDDYWRAFAGALQAQRDQLCDGLADVGLAVTVPEGTYFATTTCGRSGTRTAWRSAATCQPRRRGRDPPPGLPRRPRGRKAIRAVGVLQAARCARGGHQPPAARLHLTPGTSDPAAGCRVGPVRVRPVLSSLTSTMTVSPSRISPASSAFASWSPIADCTSRRSGRAPYTGSNPVIASHSRAAVGDRPGSAAGRPAAWPSSAPGCRRSPRAARCSARRTRRCRRAG